MSRIKLLKAGIFIFAKKKILFFSRIWSILFIMSPPEQIHNNTLNGETTKRPLKKAENSTALLLPDENEKTSDKIIADEQEMMPADERKRRTVKEWCVKYFLEGTYLNGFFKIKLGLSYT